MTTREPARRPPDSAWWTDTPSIAALEFGLARDAHDVEAAFALVHDRFVGRRYMAPEASGRRLSVHNLLPSTKVFVAKAASRVVGTATVVGDSCLGLPMDEAYGAEVGRLRERGRRIAETGALAVDPAWQASGVAITVRLFRLAALYASRVTRVDDLCFVVRPGHRAFYLALYPFRDLGAARPYPRANDARVVGLRMDLRLFRAIMRAERAGLSLDACRHFFCGPDACREILARLRRDLPRSTLTPAEWTRLFAAGVGDSAPAFAGSTVPAVADVAVPDDEAAEAGDRGRRSPGSRTSLFRATRQA